MSAPRPENVAMRDQILALLRDRHVMTTREIGDAMPRPTIWHDMPEEEVASLQAAGLRTFPWEVPPQLAALARRGLVQRVPVPGSRSVGWMLITGLVAR